MFIDTSALVAILMDEQDAERWSRAIAKATNRCTSPMVRLETCMVVASKQKRDPKAVEREFDDIIEEAGIRIIDITDEIGRLAVDAFQRYGKGRGNRAKLNLADCMSYACARAHSLPILFKGRDFGHTDLVRA